MKIAQITATFPPYYGGTGTVCYHNSLELAKLGHEVTVLTANYPKVEYEYPEILNVERLDPLFRIGNGPFLPGLLKIKNFDIVHLHYPFFFGSEMTYLNSKLRRSDYVLTYHQDVLGTGLLGYFFKFHNALLLKKIVNNAKKIFPTSLDYAKHSFIKEIVEDRPEDVIAMPNGVDIEKFNPEIDGTEVRSKYSLQDRRVILFVGALDRPHYFKGVEYLLRSFSRLEEKDTHLLIVGEGDLKNYYTDVAKKLDVSDNVTFAGRASDEDLPKYYAASDVVVLPSVTMGEAFGIVLIEAMATGKPVIASNLPGIRTVVDDGHNGLLVGPRNIDDLTSKIRYLLDRGDLRKQFGKHGRKKVVDKYTWQKIGLKLEDIYLDVLGK